MKQSTIEAFIMRVAEPRFDGMFNPWAQTCASELDCDGFLARRQRLSCHLDCPVRPLVLIGEAPGYQGCRFSGIPFTSERLLMEGLIPRLPDLHRRRITTRVRPWSEPSATIVWRALFELGLAERAVLFNAVPWHPEGERRSLSNRKPTADEIKQGRGHLRHFLELFPHAPVAALGITASSSLSALGVDHVALRHPARGGATEFRTGLQQFAEFVSSVTTTRNPCACKSNAFESPS